MHRAVTSVSCKHWKETDQQTAVATSFSISIFLGCKSLPTQCWLHERPQCFTDFVHRDHHSNKMDCPGERVTISVPTQDISCRENGFTLWCCFLLDDKRTKNFPHSTGFLNCCAHSKVSSLKCNTWTLRTQPLRDRSHHTSEHVTTPHARNSHNETQHVGATTHSDAPTKSSQKQYHCHPDAQC